MGGKSHLVFEVEAWKLGLEDRLGFGNGRAVLLSIGFAVEWLSSNDPLLLPEAEAIGEAGMDDCQVFVIGVKDIVRGVRHPPGEADLKMAILGRWIDSLSLTVNT